MANELVFNLDLNLDFPLSDYAFSSGSAGVLYFRAFRNNYIQNWKNSDNLVLNFADKNNPNVTFDYTLGASDIVSVDTEDLFKLTLSPVMMSREGVYQGKVKINGSSKFLEIDIIIFVSTTIEMSTLLVLTRKFQEDLKLYLQTAKKDMLDAPNGLALLDQNLKLKESYLPSKYRDHINSLISQVSVHEIKVDTEGIAWFLNGTNWEQWAGQPSQSGISPPVITVKDGTVTVKYDSKQTIARQKWAVGNQQIGYFSANGNSFTGSTFKVTQDGTHTLYYRDGQSQDFVQTFNVAETDIPYPLPAIKVTNGTVNITHADSSKVILQKWAQGIQDISYFQTQGAVVVNNRFNVITVGTYSLYYKLTDGREYVMSIIVDDSMLPQVILPKIEVKDGIVTIIHDPSTNVSESKWDFGTQNIAHFVFNGYVINNNTFEVYSIGKYTLYFKTVNNEERVMTFDVEASQLKADPAVDISIINGTATITYPSNIKVSTNKWAVGSRNIAYFASNGTVIVNNSFTVTQIGIHTLYYKTSEGKEYVKEFTVTIDDLPPSVVPQYSLANGNLNIVVKNESLYSANRFTWQRVEVDYFEGGGNSNQVINWKIPLTQKGWLTHYYKTDFASGVYQIEIKNEDLPNNTPTITVKDGLARVVHSQPTGVTVTDQKWSIDNKNIAFFQNGGVNVLDNKFYVVNTGVHTLYYRLSHGGEYVVTFTVTTGQLEQPVNPPTISTTMGVVTPVFDASLDIVIKKWGMGILSIPHFQNSGTVFTNTFQVATAGQYTIYIKLGNDKEYVYPFTVTEDEMQQSFIPPVINIVKGKATVAYDPSLDVTLNKWSFGNNSIPFFETGGNIITDNKFTVTTAGQHTLYTVLTGDSKHLTPFTVTAGQLPNSDPAPKITTTNGVVTIELDSTIVTTVQKWALGGQDKTYFQTQGTVFTGNTFNVLQSSIYSYYYKNSYDEEYVYHFFVDDSQLPFYAVTITVFDALMTVEYSSPVATQEAKIASGNQTIDYFKTAGDIVLNDQHPITVEGLYTFYWKQDDDREFIETFVVTSDQLVVHTPPAITIDGFDITVAYPSETEALVTEKKYDAGLQDADWFTVNGTVVTENTFTVDFYGNCSYFYKYRGRGYVLHFEIEAPPVTGITYEISIDQANSNPTTSVAYTGGDNLGFSSATYTRATNIFNWGSWEDKFPFNAIKPCILKKDGTVNYYLNPNNFTQKEDGTASNLTGADGNVMIEFPLVYWKAETTGDIMKIQVSNKQLDTGFKALAHTRQGTTYEHLYLSAYHAYSYADGGKVVMGSATGKSTMKDKFDTLRLNASNTGEGYELMDYHSATLIRILYILLFKNLNSQATMGWGVTSNSFDLSSGTTNTRGMFYGTDSGQQAIKLFGLENIWGNAQTSLDGIRLDSSRNIKVSTGDNANIGSYQLINTGLSADMSGYMKKGLGITEAPFFPIVSGGSSSTYYSDRLLVSWIQPYEIVNMGGGRQDSDAAGLFASEGKTLNDTNNMARLKYLK